MEELDLRQNGKLDIYADMGSSGPITFSNIPNLDTGYTLTLNEGNTDEVSYTVGNGITLDTNTSSVIWEFDSTPLVDKVYSGFLISDSKVFGVYLKIEINVSVQ